MITKHTYVVLLLTGLIVMPVQAQQETSKDADSSTSDTTTKQATTESNKNWGILGMNVRGNKESPMSLNIVPWRSAEHQQIDPEVTPGWQPKLVLLQPGAYRREVNAFLTARSKRENKK